MTSVTTTGALGQTTRLTIDASGTVHGLGAPLGWFVAAEDRWHDPRTDSGVRQTRLSGTPVTETRVRVPGGDVVQRVYTVADHGGITVIEVTNSSTLAVAVAFDRPDLLTERPVPGTPVEGIDLPSGSFVLPIGHGATIRVGLAHHDPASGPLPPVAEATEVVNGWLATAARAGRIEVPSPAIIESVVAARCDIACGSLDGQLDDPVGWLLSLDQWQRMELGDTVDVEMLVGDIAAAVEVVGPTTGWLADAALAAAQRLLAVADEPRAVGDVGRILDGRTAGTLPAAPPEEAPGLQRLVHTERLLVSGAELLPAGMPAAWWGQSFECHGLPSVVGSALSYAIRWHGEHPAVLWQQDGSPVTLTAPRIDPKWVADDTSGEALWPPVER